MFYTIALIIHIVFGSLALTTGFLAIVFKKGLGRHKTAGKIYYYSMILVCVSAISVSLLKEQSFLLHIGIFSGYMVYSGYRAIQEKTFYANVLDWSLLLASLINAVFMIASMNIILMVFGAIGFILTIGDLRLYVSRIQNKNIRKNQWLVRHIGMMLGGYISTFTAFLVVNLTDVQYPVLVWLLPTIIGTPLIAYWTRQTVKTNPKTP